MKPTIAVDIVDRDKTGPGRKSAEKGFGAFSKKTAIQAKESGFGRLGKQLDGLTKFRTLDFGFGGIGRSLSTISNVANDVGSGFGAATRSAVGFAAVGKGLMASLAEGAEIAAGALAAAVTAVVGLEAATYLSGEKWAGLGAEVDRTSKTFGVLARDLQLDRAAAERFGVSADSTSASIEGLGSTLYDARAGANNLALGALNQLGIKLRFTKDGAVDTQQALMDLADAIARQRDPQVQRKLASIFGVSAMLPALRQGSAALKAEGADYQGSGAYLSDDEVGKSAQVNRKTVTVKQHFAGAETRAGVLAMSNADVAADKMIAFAQGIEQHHSVTLTTLTDGAKALARSGLEAGRRLIEGGEKAGAKIVDAITAFTHRLEHQESGGHQVDRHGGTLTSSAGAMGVRQMMPGTAEVAARRAGIAWDPERFKTDAGYNRQLSDAHIAYLAKKYQGDQVLMAAAYNAGEGVLDGPYRGRDHKMHSGWIERFGDPRKGQISDRDFADQIPFDETRAYAKNVAKAHVEITLRGAPAGTVASVDGDPGVKVGMNVVRGMDGNP